MPTRLFIQRSSRISILYEERRRTRVERETQIGSSSVIEPNEAKSVSMPIILGARASRPSTKVHTSERSA